MDFTKLGLSVTGRFDLFLAVVALDRARVGCLLPDPEMHLAPVLEVPPILREGSNNLHPVVLMVGKQHQIGISTAGKPAPKTGLLEYLEAATLVPYVRLGNRNKNYSHVSLLYLNKTLPILLGRFIGLNKHRASLKQFPGQGQITAQTVSKQASLIFEFLLQGTSPTKASLTPVKKFSGFQEVEEMLSFTIVGKDDDLFLCTEPSFDYTNTVVAPVKLSCQNWGDLCPAADPDFEIDPMPAAGGPGALWVEGLDWNYPIKFPDNCYP